MKYCILLASFFVSIHLTNAQTFASNLGAFDSKEELAEQLIEEEKRPDKIPEYFRHFRKLSDTYKGYLIQLTISDLPLRRDYHLFNYFGSVLYEKIETGQYAYYIKANFSKKSKVKAFVKDIVIHSAPEAVVVEKKGFKKGKQ